MPTPLAPVQLGTSLAADLETLTEDAEKDDEESTAIEVAADWAAMPWWVAWTGLAAPVAIVWSFGDLLTGDPDPDPARRFEQLRPALPVRFHEPDPWTHRPPQPVHRSGTTER